MRQRKKCWRVVGNQFASDLSERLEAVIVQAYRRAAYTFKSTNEEDSIWAAYSISRNMIFPDNGRLHIFVPDQCKSEGRSGATSSSMGVCGFVVIVYGRLGLRRPLSWEFHYSETSESPVIPG